MKLKRKMSRKALHEERGPTAHTVKPSKGFAPDVEQPAIYVGRGVPSSVAVTQPALECDDQSVSTKDGASSVAEACFVSATPECEPVPLHAPCAGRDLGDPCERMEPPVAEGEVPPTGTSAGIGLNRRQRRELKRRQSVLVASAVPLHVATSSPPESCDVATTAGATAVQWAAPVQGVSGSTAYAPDGGGSGGALSGERPAESSDGAVLPRSVPRKRRRHHRSVHGAGTA
jgi:hypothetical protein